MGSPPSQVLSLEFEQCQGRILLQGDVIEKVSVYKPGNMAKPFGDSGESATFIAKPQDVIIVTQSCDMIEGQPGTLDMILVAPIWRLSESAEFDTKMGSPYYRDLCRQGMVFGAYLIPECTSGAVPREASVVSFRTLWTLPLEYVRAQADARGPRLRLRPPYREDFSQAFARYFMRVGLERVIPPFSDDKEAQRIALRLGNLSQQQREQILAGFR